MGEPAIPSATERALTRASSLTIVDSVRNDEAMPLPFEWPKNTPLDCPDCPVSDVEDFIFELAQENTLLADQLDFINHAARTAMQTAVPDDAKRLLMAEIRMAAREHRLPEWWPAFRDERDAGSKHG